MAAYWEMYDKFVAQDCHGMEDQVTEFGGSQDFLDFVSLCLKKDPRDRPSTASLLEHRFLATGDGKSPMPQASSTDHIEKAKKAELLAVVTTCKEHGVTFPRKTTSFRVIAAQVGVTESYCEEVFCPRKSKQQRQTPTRRKSSAANINKVGILAKEGLMTTKETLIKSSPMRALKKAFSTKGEKSFGGGREEEEPIVLGG